jgi:hypothetical protein
LSRLRLALVVGVAALVMTGCATSPMTTGSVGGPDFAAQSGAQRA